MYDAALKTAATQPPATKGTGEPPVFAGGPPPPENVGKVDTGIDGNALMVAGGDCITSLKKLQGLKPERAADISEWISQIKQLTMPKPNEGGPGVGQPGIPGSNQLDTSPLMDSGSPGSM